MRPLPLAVAAWIAAGCAVDHTLGTDLAAGGGGGGGGGEPETTAASSSASGGGEAPSIAGDYDVVLTERTNGCAFTDVTEGDTSVAAVAVRQDGDAVSLLAKDLAAISIGLLLGTNEWNGVLRGESFVLVAPGELTTQKPDCTHSWVSVIDGVAADDTLRGTISYRPSLPDEPACAKYACETSQSFEATRVAR